MKRAIILLLLLTPLAFVRSCELPDFKELAKPPQRALGRVPVPVFKLPKQDAENGLVALFVSGDGDNGKHDRIVWTAVFADEDHPVALFDLIYDFYRWQFGYQRVADVESFVYHYEGDWRKAPEAYKELSFPTTWAGDQAFDVGVARHHSQRLPAKAFGRRGRRPVIYIQTWNHLFQSTSKLSEGNLITVDTVPLYEGSRAQVEKLFRSLR